MLSSGGEGMLDACACGLTLICHGEVWLLTHDLWLGVTECKVLWYPPYVSTRARVDRLKMQDRKMRNQKAWKELETEGPKLVVENAGLENSWAENTGPLLCPILQCLSAVCIQVIMHLNNMHCICFLQVYKTFRRTYATVWWIITNSSQLLEVSTVCRSAVRSKVLVKQTYRTMSVEVRQTNSHFQVLSRLLRKTCHRIKNVQTLNLVRHRR